MKSRRLRLRALRIMLDLARAGVRESAGNNRGPMVDRITDYARGQRGEPYCVNGVIWAYGHAGSTVVRPGFPRAVRLMDVPGVHITLNPKAGCPIRYRFDHTGLLIGWRRYVRGRLVRCPRKYATHLLAVEANTSASGALEVSDGHSRGDGIHVKVRPLGQVQDYLYVTR